MNEDRSARLRKAIFEDRDGGFDVRDRQIEVAVAVVVAAGKAPAHVGLCEVRSRLRLAAAEAVAVEAEEEWFLEERRGVGIFDDMAVGNDDIDPAVGVEIIAGRPEADKQPTDVGDAVAAADMEEVATPFVAVEGKPLALEVRHPHVGETVAVEVAQVDPHAPVGHPLIVEGRAADEPVLRKMAMAVVDVEEVVGGVVGDIDIDIAIDVEIGQKHSQPLAVAPQTGRSRGIGKRAVAVAETDRVGQPLERPRRTDVTDGRRRPAAGMVVERPVDVAGEIEIEDAIAVEIGPAGARAPTGVFSGRRRRNDERAVPHVAPELRHPIPGDEEILEAVVVVIADGDAVRIEGGRGNASLGRRWMKRLAIFAAEQRARPPVNRLLGRDPAAAGGDEIEPSVAVEVKPPHAAAERLEDRAVIRLATIAVGRRDSQLGGPLHEVDPPTSTGLVRRGSAPIRVAGRR